MSNRRARFREYMRRLDVSASAGEAIKDGLYVTPSGRSVADDLAARLEIKPASSHVVLGGVGSGKTTELVLACERLNQHEDTRAVYIDVSEHRDLQQSHLHLVPLVIEQLCALAETFRGQSPEINWGVIADCLYWLEDAYDDRPPSEIVTQLRAELAKANSHTIVVLDSLDRMSSTEQFVHQVDDILPPLQRSGIGVVLTGPLHLLYGASRSVLDRFDRFYHLPVVNVRAGNEGADFLLRVLRARVPADVCPDSVCRQLAELSGGVLRDLIALTQSAVEEAYAAGADTVEDRHVAIAADAFGRKHLLGLDSPAIEVLQRVRKTGQFVQTSDRDIALLLTRRVLEYHEDRGPRFAVHPTIAPLLEQMGAPS